MPVPYLAAPAAEVHIWWAELDRPAAELARLRRTLTGAELARAEQFRFAVDRRRWLAARGILRRLLGLYTQQPPETVRLEAGPEGKPRLADQAVQFNLAHSGARAVYAVAQGRAVGVDVEAVQADFSAEAVAGLVFSPAELAAWQARPAPERSLAFYTLWTRKEAYAKAGGAGLALALPAITLGWQTEVQVGGWAVCSLPAEPGYAAALAVAGRGASFSVRRWPAGRDRWATEPGWESV